MNRKIMQMQIEETALKKEDDSLSKERLENLQKELADLKDSFDSQKAQWTNEKEAVDRLAIIREEIESANTELAIAQRRGDFEKASELQYGKIPELKSNWSQRNRR